MYTKADGTEVDLLTLSEQEWRSYRGREVSLVFQEPLTALNPVQRVGKQLMEAVRSMCPEINTESARVNHLSEWLRRVELPDDQQRILAAYPHELSGGQRQRILIALALFSKPRLLIADEPTTALDTITESGILDLLERLRDELGMSLIFITHDLDVLARTTDRALVLAGGELQHAGSTTEILALPNAGLSKEEPVKTLHGPSREQTSNKEGVALSVQDLTVSYTLKKNWPWSPTSSVPAVRKVSFLVAPGEWLALVGPSGCGKSTLARCLAGLVSPSGGTISGLRKGEAQLIFQDPYSSLNPSHDLRTILSEVLRLQAEAKHTAASLLEAVGLPAEEFSGRKPAALSGGQRQRVAIARALAANPRLLIADEAVSALDGPLRREVLDLLDDLRLKEGFGVLFISHDLRLVRQRADRVLIMDKGQIVEEGTPKQVLTTPVSAMGEALVKAIGIRL